MMKIGWLASIGAALLLPGCAALDAVQRVPKVDVVDATHVEPVVETTPVRSNGAIFQGDRYRPLFEDHRARLVGDTLTVSMWVDGGECVFQTRNQHGDVVIDQGKLRFAS